MPGVLNLVALALYTRLLSPPDYGRYTLVITTVIVANAVAFYWLRVSAVRQLPSDLVQRAAFTGALYATHLRVSLAVIAVALAAGWAAGPELRPLIAVGTLVLLSQAWFELNLDLHLAALNPPRYAALAIARALVALVVGGLLAWQGFGPMGVLIGSAGAFLISAGAASIGNWSTARVLRPDPTGLRRIISFGLPLAGAFSVGVLTTGIDRFLLGWLAGTQAVGQYAAAADLTLQTLTALMMVLSMSALPVAVRAQEAGGTAASAVELSRHGVRLVAVAVPATAGLALLAPQIAAAFLGPLFRESAIDLIPLIAVGSLFAGLKAFYFDVAFQLADATKRQLYVAIAGAALGVSLNLWFIPTFGVRGPAYAMVFTFAVMCGMSAVIGRRSFLVPLPAGEWAKILAAAGIMIAALWPARHISGGITVLALAVSWGFMVYLIAAVLLDVGGSRQRVSALMRRGGTA